MNSPRTDRHESPPVSLPALVWHQVLPELSAGERVVWCGQPVLWRMAVRQAVMPGCGLVFGLAVVGFLAAVDGALRWGGIESWFLNVSFWVACAASVFALLYLGCVPPLASWCARQTGYVITNRRAMLVLSEGKILSYSPAQMQDLLVHRLPDGSGEILFERRVVGVNVTDSEGCITGTRTEVHVVGFLELADVDEPRRALAALLGREVPAEPVTTLPADYFHPL